MDDEQGSQALKGRLEQFALFDVRVVRPHLSVLLKIEIIYANKSPFSKYIERRDDSKGFAGCEERH